MNSFRRNIRPHVDAELQAANIAEAEGASSRAFAHLESAHVLGQAATLEHIRVHWCMLIWGLRHHQPRECIGQLLRIVGAATKTAVGFVPEGNTGGTNVSPFQPMPLPLDLKSIIDQARGRPTSDRR